MNEWIKNVIKHKYLKFTFESSMSSVNFLDVKVTSCKQNKISTELFTKPMSKHVYLHSNSDHPSHLKNSLFYSQGLRVIRLCSEFSMRISNLIQIHNKFLDRGYDQTILHNTLLTLIMKDRFLTLKPQRDFLINYLNVQNPNILEKYNIAYDGSNSNDLSSNNQNVYLVFPFYKCVKKYKQTIINCVKTGIKNDCSAVMKNAVESMLINVVFSRTKNLKELLKS